MNTQNMSARMKEAIKMDSKDIIINIPRTGYFDKKSLLFYRGDEAPLLVVSSYVLKTDVWQEGGGFQGYDRDGGFAIYGDRQMVHEDLIKLSLEDGSEERIRTRDDFDPSSHKINCEVWKCFNSLQQAKEAANSYRSLETHEPEWFQEEYKGILENIKYNASNLQESDYNRCEAFRLRVEQNIEDQIQAFHKRNADKELQERIKGIKERNRLLEEERRREAEYEADRERYSTEEADFVISSKPEAKKVESVANLSETDQLAALKAAWGC